MSYKITARVFNANPNQFFRLVEQGIWNYANGGTYSGTDSEIILTMGGSGTAGGLRFLSDKGEGVFVALGVHNYKRWGDVVTGLTGEATAVSLLPDYYNEKRSSAREKQLAQYSVKSAKGTTFMINFTVSEGNDLVANIIFN